MEGVHDQWWINEGKREGEDDDKGDEDDKEELSSEEESSDKEALELLMCFTFVWPLDDTDDEDADIALSLS